MGLKFSEYFEEEPAEYGLTEQPGISPPSFCQRIEHSDELELVKAGPLHQMIQQGDALLQDRLPRCRH